MPNTEKELPKWYYTTITNKYAMQDLEDNVLKAIGKGHITVKNILESTGIHPLFKNEVKKILEKYHM